jgi:hypothetical protein
MFPYRPARKAYNFVDTYMYIYDDDDEYYDNGGDCKHVFMFKVVQKYI